MQLICHFSFHVIIYSSTEDFKQILVDFILFFNCMTIFNKDLRQEEIKHLKWSHISQIFEKGNKCGTKVESNFDHPLITSPFHFIKILQQTKLGMIKLPLSYRAILHQGDILATQNLCTTYFTLGVHLYHQQPLRAKEHKSDCPPYNMHIYWKN